MTDLKDIKEQVKLKMGECEKYGVCVLDDCPMFDVEVLLGLR